MNIEQAINQPEAYRLPRYGAGANGHAAGGSLQPAYRMVHALRPTHEASVVAVR